MRIVYGFRSCARAAPASETRVCELVRDLLRHISDRRECSCLQASSLRDDSLHSTRSGVECGGIDVSPPGPGGTSCTPGPEGGREADEWTSNYPSLTKLVLGGRISIGSSSPSSSFFFFFRRVFVSFFF